MGRGGVQELAGPTATAPRRAVSGVVGIEHEFTVRDESGPVDFRSVLTELDVGVGGLDPGDGRARRLDTGGLLTADGREAEIATPPVALVPGFTTRLVEHTDAARRHLADALGGVAAVELDGYSTHVNVQVADRRVVRVARRFVGSFAPAMMLLMDRKDSPGLLVRPRRGRLELCGEHVDRDQLRAATLFAAAAAAQLSRSSAPRHLRVRGDREPAVERFGWYVDRTAYGPDLYALGRSTRLGDRTAQDHLAACWEWTRPAAFGLAGPEELALVDDIVAGRRPLPLEAEAPRLLAPPTTRVDDPFGSVLRERRRGPLTITARLVTWPFVLLDVARGDRTVHLGIPGPRLGPVLDQLDHGELDTALHDLLDRADRLPVLVAEDQTRSVGAFRAVGRLEDLVPGERDPLTGRIGGPGGPGSRRSKERQEQQPRPKPKPKALVAAAVVAAVVVAGVAVAVAAGGDDPRVVASGGDLPAAPVQTVDTTSGGADPGGGPREFPQAPPLTKDPCTLLDPATISAWVTAFTGGQHGPVAAPAPVQGSSEPNVVEDPDTSRYCHWTFDQVEEFGDAGLESLVELELRRVFSVELDGTVAESSCDHLESTAASSHQLPGIGEIAYGYSPYIVTACSGHVLIDVHFEGLLGDGGDVGWEAAAALLSEALEKAGDG